MNNEKKSEVMEFASEHQTLLYWAVGLLAAVLALWWLHKMYWTSPSSATGGAYSTDSKAAENKNRQLAKLKELLGLMHTSK